MKKMVIGLLIGLMLGMATNASAIGEIIQAQFAQFNYVVNGVAQPPGVTAIVYDGISYLRTTDLGNMLGYDVTYKANSRTIEFNNKPVTATPAPSIVPVPSTSLSATPAPTGGIPSPTPTPSGPTPTPDPNATPAPSAAPGPSATPAPSVAPTTVPTAVPTPAPYTGPNNPGGDSGRLQTCMSLPRDSVMFTMYRCSDFGL